MKLNYVAFNSIFKNLKAKARPSLGGSLKGIHMPHDPALLGAEKKIKEVRNLNKKAQE